MAEVIHIRRRWLGASTRGLCPKGEVVTPEQHNDKIQYAINALNKLREEANKERQYDLVLTWCHRTTVGAFARAVACSEVTCPLCLVADRHEPGEAAGGRSKSLIYTSSTQRPHNQVGPDDITLEIAGLKPQRKRMRVKILGPYEPIKVPERTSGNCGTTVTQAGAVLLGPSGSSQGANSAMIR